MHVSVNGVRLFFDVEGAKLVPDGPGMRQKPTLLLLHGGPGFDHSIYKPAYSALADIAQIIYLDHRGNGRSEDGPRESWHLAQWGDDVRAFCDALGITEPIVLGASFGGMVALAYATRHPDHPSKLVLISTEAAGDTYLDRRVALFERFGGPEVGALAPQVSRRRQSEGSGCGRRLAKTRLPCLYADAARPEPWKPHGRKAGGGTALFRKTGRREPHLQHVPRSPSHPVPYPRHGRRRRSNAPDREPGGYRKGATRPSGAVRTLCELRACRGARCA
jgi:pimeloyl-ACP methyl ester carboxylesterase